MTPAPVPPDGETDAPIPDWEFAGREEDRIRGAQEHAYARGFAAGRAAAHPAGHIYDGSCPDDTQPDARDPKCPACAAAHPDPPDMTNMCEGESPDHKPGITPAATPDERLREALALVYVMLTGAEPMWAEMPLDERCARAANEAQQAFLHAADVLADQIEGEAP